VSCHFLFQHVNKCRHAVGMRFSSSVLCGSLNVNLRPRYSVVPHVVKIVKFVPFAFTSLGILGRVDMFVM